MNLEELFKEHPELKTQYESDVEAKANGIAEQVSKGLLAKNNQLMDELKPLKDFRKKLGDDFDPENYQKMLQDRKNSERQGMLEKGEIDKVLEKMNSEFESERNQWKQQFEKETGELNQKLQAKDSLAEKLFSNGVISPLVAPFAINKRAAQVLIDDIRQMVDIEEKDGDLIPKVRNGIKGDGSSKTLDELVGEMLQKPEYAPFVRGVNATGSGATSSLPGGAGNKTMKRDSFERLGDTEKAKYLSDGGKLTD